MYPPIIDVEASGFGQGSYPIEVGFALESGKTYCTLIKPLHDWTHWDERAAALHGINKDLLNQRGQDIIQVAEILNFHLKDKIVYTDGWGVDSSWLALLFDQARVAQHFKLETLNAILSDKQKNHWDNTKYQVIKDLGVCRHRASSDARVIQETFKRTKQ